MDVYTTAQGFIDSIHEMSGGERPETCPWYSFATEIVADVAKQNLVGQTNPHEKLHQDLPKPLYEAVVYWTARTNKVKSEISKMKQARAKAKRDKSAALDAAKRFYGGR